MSAFTSVFDTGDWCVQHRDFVYTVKQAQAVSGVEKSTRSLV
jgi:hypothetical protein